jgi:tRNA G46 methylase TrmB
LPKVIIEPTCGKGNFIIASLKNFKNISSIYGVEIYKPYVWETKFNIVNFYLENPQINKPEISISHCNVFDFDFKVIAKQFTSE